MSEDRSTSEERARRLLERGDLGVGPNVTRATYPRVYGDGPYASIWKATVGATYDDYMENQRRIASERQPSIYVHKRTASKKRGKDKPNWSNGILDTNLNDAMPRNMTMAQFSELYAAISFCNTGGRVMTAHVPITWSCLGYIDHEEAAKALVRFTKCLREWCWEHKFVALYVYAHECGDRVGLHTHLLAAIPPEHLKAFKRWVLRCLSRIAKTKAMPKEACRPVLRADESIYTQWEWFRYLCKGLDPLIAVRQKSGDCVYLSDLVNREYESPGDVECKKRIGVSSNIGASARMKVGYSSLFDQGVFDIRRLYKGEEYSEWQRLQGLEEIHRFCSSPQALARP